MTRAWIDLPPPVVDKVNRELSEAYEAFDRAYFQAVTPEQVIEDAEAVIEALRAVVTALEVEVSE